MKYSFDTCSFIELNESYPQDLFPYVWDRFSDLIESGVIVATIYAYDEIRPVQDKIYQYLKERRAKVFQSSDAEQDQIVSNIVNDLFPDWVDMHSTSNRADPFVIALAKKFGLTVVTEEKLNPDRVKIPQVCIALGVKCFNLLQFMRETKVTAI